MDVANLLRDRAARLRIAVASDMPRATMLAVADDLDRIASGKHPNKRLCAGCPTPDRCDEQRACLSGPHEAPNAGVVAPQNVSPTPVTRNGEA